MSINRLKEPSTWAGLGVLISAFMPDLPDEVLQAGVQAITGIVGLAAIFTSEKGGK